MNSDCLAEDAALICAAPVVVFAVSTDAAAAAADVDVDFNCRAITEQHHVKLNST